VPGVLLLDEVLRAVESANSLDPALWRVGSAKFVKPVRPGETLTLEHQRLPNGSIGFSIASAGRAVARGVLIVTASQDEPGDGQQAG
jgi:3-hydroxyacyl-[acyl-carrier-protein] dehydratase